MRNTFVHRWSKQKTEQSDKELKPASEQPPAGIETAVTPEGEIPNSEQAEETKDKEIELPPIETLGDDSDYSAFMSGDVDEKIKQLALRRLFKAPFYNITDGLNDYDEDFTTFEALGDIITSDMKFHEERKKAEQLAREQSEQADEIQPPDTLASDEPDQPYSDEEEIAEEDRTVSGESEIPDDENTFASANDTDSEHKSASAKDADAT